MLFENSYKVNSLVTALQSCPPAMFIMHILEALTENNKALEVFLDEFRCNM